MDIGIVGCGIGGLAVGALLAQSGHNVVIYDRFAKPEPVGSGLVIQPVGMDVLRAVGAEAYALNKGNKINHMLGREAHSNRKVLDVSYGKRHGTAIHRASLFEALYQAAIMAGVIIKPNENISKTTLKSNKRCIGDAAYDLVIDASGAGSVLSPIIRKALPFGALWATVDWPTTEMPQDHLSQKYKGAGNMVGVLPIGQLPGETTQKATIFWSLPQEQHQDWLSQPLGKWQENAQNLWPEMAPFLDQITSHDDLTMANYSHGTLKKPFAERFVHIGDSAHCASPQLGQGANMALLDALALAKAINQFPVTQAPEKYAKSRLRHVRTYQLMSAVFTPMYQSNSRLLPFLRNWFFAPLTYVPPAPWVVSNMVCGSIVKPIKGLK